MSAGVVIVGAGHAGGRTALLLAERGYKGPVTLVGEERLPPYERPSLSKQMLADPATAPDFLGTAKDFEDKGITLLLGQEVTGIEREQRTVLLADGAHLSYDYLVLATGGRPRQLPFRLNRLHTLRTVDDVHAIATLAAGASSVLIVGGGVIGLEVAATLMGKGLAVTIVECGSRLLGRNFPSAIAAMIADRHCVAGVTVHTGVQVVSMSEDAAGVHAVLSNNQTLRADFAVAGIGITPDTRLAAEAGLAVNDGVVVDPWMRTSDPRIFAVGDVAAQRDPLGRTVRYETWQNANITAERAAAGILGAPLPQVEPPWFWTDQYDWNVQLAGDTGPDLEGVSVVQQTSANPGGMVFLFLRQGHLIGAGSVNAGPELSLCRRLIAAGAELPSSMIAATSFDRKAARALLSASPVSVPSQG